MNSLLRNPATPIWLLLMLATGLSWWLGTSSSANSDNGIFPDYRYISSLLMIIAFVKVRFVIRYFMEVRTAPLALRLIADAWVIGICLAILGLYWFPPGA